MAVRKDPEGWGGPRREQGLFEQAPWPGGSWQECLEQGGEHSGGLKRKLEPGMGALSLAAWRNEKGQISPTLVNASSQGEAKFPTPFP